MEIRYQPDQPEDEIELICLSDKEELCLMPSSYPKRRIGSNLNIDGLVRNYGIRQFQTRYEPQ